MERFAKLNAKVVDPNSGGAGGKPGQSAQIDTAHGMRGIPPAAFYLANLKFGNGGPQDQAEILARLFDAVRDYVAVERNRRRRGAGPWDDETARRLVRTALAECLEEPKCRRCKGEKTVPPHDEKCPICIGSGRRRWAETKVMAGAGLTFREWRKSWKSRYVIALSILSGWEGVAAVIFRANNPREFDVR